VNVVYDLRYATDHFPGIGTHAHALLEALLRLPSDDRYRVLWRAGDRATRFDPAAFAAHPRVDWTAVDAASLGWRAPLATGAWLRRLGGDLYFSPFYLRPVRARMPVVLTLADAMHLAPESGSSTGLRLMFALALRHARAANAAITPSEFSRTELVRRAGFAAERLHVIAQGVPPRSQAPAERPGGAPDRPFALVVGANRPHKDLKLLASAWHILGEARPLDLVAAGALDPRFPSLAGLSHELRTEGTHTLGAVTPGQLEWLYANATLKVTMLYQPLTRPVQATASSLPSWVGGKNSWAMDRAMNCQ
jgi:alpha-1,3-rhamnosyl/mannosyltransferase